MARFISFISIVRIGDDKAWSRAISLVEAANKDEAIAVLRADAEATVESRKSQWNGFVVEVGIQVKEISSSISSNPHFLLDIDCGYDLSFEIEHEGEEWKEEE